MIEENKQLINIWLSRLPIFILAYFVFYNGEFGNLLNINSAQGLDPFWGIIRVAIISGVWLFSRKWPRYRKTDKVPIIILLALFITFPAIKNWWWWNFYGGGNPPDISFYRMMLDNGLLIVLVLVISYAIEDKEFGKYLKVRYLLILFLVIRIKYYTIISFPSPSIDVWDTLTLAPSYLLEGKNPYSELYTQFYSITPDYYPYPPGMILVLIPFSMMQLDVRYFFLLVEILLTLVIYHKAGRTTHAELFSLVLLLNPFSYFFLHYAWTDPFLVFGIALLIFYGTDPKYIKWRPLGFALLATIKQSFWVLLPFYALFLLVRKMKGIKEGITFLGVFIAIMLPFYLWSPSDFIQDIWLFHLDQIRIESLTINSYLFWEYNSGIGRDWFFIPYGLLLLTFFLQQHNNTEESAKFIDIFRFGLFGLLLFNLFGKLAFMNHYYTVIAGFYLILLIQSLNHKPEQNDIQNKLDVGLDDEKTSLTSPSAPSTN